MANYITELQVSLNKSEEDQFKSKGLTRIYKNLNEGAGGSNVYLWYKKAATPGITRIQFSFDTNSSDGLSKAKYTKINKNLNQGTSGDEIYLWYSIDQAVSKIRITDLDVSTDPTQAANHMIDGWEPLTCNLNRNAGGNRIYLWVKREKPTWIKEIIATDKNTGDAQLFTDGYIRLDENINGGTGGNEVLIWYLPTVTQAEAIRDLQVSVNKDQYKTFTDRGYDKVNQDLNEGTGGNQIYLFYKKKDGKKNIQSLILLSDKRDMAPFQVAEVTVINKDLNSGSGSIQSLLLAFY